MRKPIGLLLAGLLALTSLCGCTTYLKQRLGRAEPADRMTARLKPVVAVMDFDNRASFEGKWDLATGMADLIVAGLLEKDQVTVLERKHIDDLVEEIMRQGKDLFRSEGRVEKGKLKNAKYIIRGTITDFVVTGDTTGWFSTAAAAGSRRGSQARAAISIKVSDVETGEIVVSVTADKALPARGSGRSVDYRKLSFGGDAFLQTPLGKATDHVVKQAVTEILAALPGEYWQARVAEAGPDTVIINGGENAHVQAGDVFLVREEGRQVLDPVTGNVIETIAGKVLGQVEVVEVKALSAHAVVREGVARRGDFLEWQNRPVAAHPRSSPTPTLRHSNTPPAP